ncbi:hypothetical protein Sste5344_000457 [Sporothrix stenoceras]
MDGFSIVYGQFDGLKKLQGVRRVISFGGWGFSNAPSTYGVFRRIVHSQGSRGVAAKNIVQFVVDNGLDGVTDIPGTPAGDPVTEGSNYLEFLKTVRSLLPKEKTLSIAAPASYWYLQHFPIKDMATVVDYIIYMTYDLHGQWDYGNQYSTCLRSHVNLTETMTALGLITKAGVSADKVIVGGE